MFGKILKITLFVLVSAAATFYMYKYLDEQSSKDAILKDFAFGNGRIESTQIHIATKISGRLVEVYVNEGDIVEKGRLLAKLDTGELEAKLRLAQAQIKEAKEGKNHALALLEQRKSELSLAKENFLRAEALYKKMPSLCLASSRKRLHTNLQKHLQKLPRLIWRVWMLP